MIYPSLKLGLLRVINAQPTAGIVHVRWTKPNQGSELGGLALDLDCSLWCGSPLNAARDEASVFHHPHSKKLLSYLI